MVVPAIGQYGRYSLITMMNLPYSAMMRVLRRLTPPASVHCYWTDCIDYSCVNIYPGTSVPSISIFCLCEYDPNGHHWVYFTVYTLVLMYYLHILIRIGCKLASFLCVVLYLSGVLTLACMYVVTCPGMYCRFTVYFSVSCDPTRSCLFKILRFV